MKDLIIKFRHIWKTDQGFKMIPLLVLVVALASGVMSMNTVARFLSSAAGEAVTIYFNPASATLPPNITLRMMMDAKTNRVVFTRAVLRFNPSQVRIVGEIIPAGTLGRVVEVTQVATANTTGQAVVVLATNPGTTPPTGVFEIAHFSLAALTTAQNVAATLDYLTSDTEVVEKGEMDLPMNATSALLTLNPTVATATPRPTSILTSTPGPTVVPSATPRPIITVTPAPTIRPTVMPNPTPVPGGGFNFISWSDTETSLATLATLSNQAATLGPEFTIYNGDAEGGQGLSGWQTYLNGSSSNGMSNKTFVVRGNGNSGDSTWATFFNFATVASNVGAANYTEMTHNMTYSFDYGNSRFIGIDTPGCANIINQSQVDWAEGRIRDAETRGLTHVFMFMHGPIYYVDNHTTCTPPSNLVNVINSHAIVTAVFHGHEHTKADVRFGIGDSRLGLVMTHNFDQIDSGGAGGGTYPCNSARINAVTDYCASYEGYANVTVSGGTVTIDYYGQGSGTSTQLRKTITIIK